MRSKVCIDIKFLISHWSIAPEPFLQPLALPCGGWCLYRSQAYPYLPLPATSHATVNSWLCASPLILVTV
ncbi:Uncharacterised protein [Vibrio cholerae]|nr:Uncharacterised protein [Vibrio cholerae]